MGPSICLGLVIMARADEVDAVIAALEGDPRLELGDARVGRLPVCAVTAIGDDERLIAEIEAHRSVVSVQVVYVHVLDEKDAS
jgi:hypothetical protein